MPSNEGGLEEKAAANATEEENGQGDDRGVLDRQPGAKRLGRKQPRGAPQGVVITDEIEEVFKEAVRRFVANDRRNSLGAAYRMMRAENWVGELVDRVTGVKS